MSVWAWITYTILSLIIAYLYIARNDRAILHVPSELATLGIVRYTTAMAREAMDELLEAEKRGEAGKGNLKVSGEEPGRTGRRYIVVGGVCALSILFWDECQLMVCEEGRLPGRLDCSAAARAWRESQGVYTYLLAN